jgi:predicted RNA-binding Zn-ribbon protein involved in translation (DUF1610 family)
MIQIEHTTGTAVRAGTGAGKGRAAGNGDAPPTAVFWLAVCAATQQRVGSAARWCVCPDCGNWRVELPRDGRCQYCREPIF